MLRSWQADGFYEVTVGDRTVQLHQGDVIVKGEFVVVRVRYDLLQIPLLNWILCLSLFMKAEVNFPRARLGESEEAHNKTDQGFYSRSQLLMNL